MAVANLVRSPQMVSTGELPVVLFWKQVGENRPNPAKVGSGARFPARWEKMGRIADRAVAHAP